MTTAAFLTYTRINIMPPRVGTKVTYTPTGTVRTVVRIEGNLCWLDHGDESLPFIWRFGDGTLNTLHEWEGKPCVP